MDQGAAPRIILLEPSAERRNVLAGRLRAQGYDVEPTGSPEDAANRALANPPSALIADLWMDGISGVQLCRLLKAEAATAHVPVILRGYEDAQHDRFWAERAGAMAYVPKGRVGQLVRELARARAIASDDGGFFTFLSEEAGSIRDRIAHHLDRALREAVLAAEVRALATCESFDRLFDLFSQFLCQVCSYRWLAVYVPEIDKIAIHTSPALAAAARSEALAALNCTGATELMIEDDDATDACADEPICIDAIFASTQIARIALAPCEERDEANELASIIARELGGPLRMALLVETSRRLAMYDPLTGILNRRAFASAAAEMVADADDTKSPIAVLLLDIDHFKAINDEHGHRAGDSVLRAVGACLCEHTREADICARWGGEEFVIAMPGTDKADGIVLGERLREKIAALEIRDGDTTLSVTASFGLAIRTGKRDIHEVVEQADHAMYTAKVGGRNRLEAA